MGEAVAGGTGPGSTEAQDGALALSGRLTIVEAETMRDELARALTGCRCLSLDTTDLETVDVAGIQLIISARHSAGRAGKSVRLAPAPGAGLLAALVAAGFRTEGDGARPDASQDGFWWGRS